MSEKRILRGTSAALVGLGIGVGSGLLIGTATAHADGAESDTVKADAPAAQATAGTTRTAPAPSRRGTSGPARGVPAPAAATDETPTARGASTTTNPRAQSLRSARNLIPDVPAATTPAQVAAVQTPAPRVVVDTPGVQPTVTAAAASVSAPVAASAPETPDIPELAPATALLVGALSALGYGGEPGAPAATGTPVPATAASQRASAESVAVTGTAATVATDPLLPGFSNGVSGVQIGHSRLEMPGAFIGNTVAADWYFPTQVDGTVDAQGVIWLQHGFGAINSFYSALATDLAMQTNSIVVAPTLSSIPFTFSGGCLVCTTSQEAAAALFLDPDRAALLDSALAAGYTGNPTELLGAFVLSGHSAGGGFATAVASDYLDQGTGAQDAELAGVVMFDGVSNGASDGTFTEQVDVLLTAGTPIYQIAAPAQSWNAFGATSNALAEALAGNFAGVVLTGGSHVDSMIGSNPIIDLVLQLVTQFVPAGNTDATHLLSTGWINDMYAGNTPQTAQYGFYAGANEAIIMGPTAALGLPSPVLNQLSFGDRILTSVIDAVGSLFGFSILPTPYNYGSNGLDSVIVPPLSNGVTGVRTGSAVLDIPAGENGYAAPADWYFPTQADGTVAANGVIWLQHGFLGFKSWYAEMAQQLAQQTNSIVVVPNIFWFDTPLCPGCYLGGEVMREAVASMFQDQRSALNVSANAAGLQGFLPEHFLLTGHSAGGNFATATGALITDTPQVDNLLGVVMFDGVSREPLFTDSLAALDAAGIPDYQIAAPPQPWNAWGVATELMEQYYPGRFNGVQIDNGSHTDVIAGDSLFAELAEIASAILVRPSPPGAKEAERTFATGWVNDIYGGFGPSDPFYGIYGNPNDGTYVPNQIIGMGQITATVLPAPPPVDVVEYSGTWYEQGSVKQFFSLGLVNTTAVYTPQPGGTIKVENSGNYFWPNGPQSTITGSAVPVNEANTRLNVGFFLGEPNSDEPGNYWILDYAPDYSWAIVGDPSGFSGYILTREQTFRADNPDAYDALVTRARQLGVWGPITPTEQVPTTGSGAALPAAADVPSGLVL
ncbi:MAG: lipocalin family protein [Mycobacterium sp.]|nr:lipocalin family protein [Mycobacterium sp.]